MDLHNFGKLDPDAYGTYQSGQLNPDPHQSEKQDPDPHQRKKVEALEDHK